MKRKLIITQDPIHEMECAQTRECDPESGAVLTFLGTVRGKEGSEQIAGLEYESFEKMALHQFNLILDQVEQRWPIRSIRLIHRLGRVDAGFPSLFVEVAAPHRGEAFEACEWLIHEMKKKVPIWKKPLPV